MPSPTAEAARAALAITGIDARREVVTIVNRGTAAQNLTGWKMFSGPEGKVLEYEFPSGFVLGAGQSVRLHSKGGKDSASDLYWRKEPANGSRNIWGKQGDVAILRDARNKEVSRLTY